VRIQVRGCKQQLLNDVAQLQRPMAGNAEVFAGIANIEDG
jgi:hypothetical protein